MQTRPLGLIATDADSIAVAERLARTGTRVLHYFLAGSGKPEPSPYLEAASTPADIAIECEIVIVAIDDTRRLRELMIGTADRPGLAGMLRAGTVIIDMGIRPPREAQALLGLVGMRGVGVTDAALVGGRDAIRSGAATVLVGGFPDAVDAVVPVLGELGRVERTGPLGSAQTAAALMGYVEAAHFEARADALHVGRTLGLNGATLTHVLAQEPEQSNIVRIQRRAELIRTLARDRGISGDIIDFRRTEMAGGPQETR